MQELAELHVLRAGGEPIKGSTSYYDLHYLFESARVRSSPVRQRSTIETRPEGDESRRRASARAFASTRSLCVMRDQFAMSSMCLPQPRQKRFASRTQTLMQGESSRDKAGGCIDRIVTDALPRYPYIQ